MSNARFVEANVYQRINAKLNQREKKIRKCERLYASAHKDMEEIHKIAKRVGVTEWLKDELRNRYSAE